MYHATLVNLSADARTAAVSLSPVERRGLGPDEVRALLANFQAVDPVENAAADPEIRIRVRQESYLVRLGNRTLIFYDIQRRDLPAQLLGVDAVMAELDGSASLARARAQTAAVQAALQPAAEIPAPARNEPSNPARLAVLGGLAAGLTAALAWLWWPDPGERVDAVRLSAEEAKSFYQLHAGVYLTGSQPGQHGIALTTIGDLKLFELQAVEAPRVVPAGCQPVRAAGRLGLATDQPGGLIMVADRDTLVYGGENYRRLP